MRFGTRRVPVKLVQELRGSAQYWISAQPALGLELPAIDRMLRGRGIWAEPCGDEMDQEEAWEEFSLSLELFRIMFEDPKSWSTHFSATFGNMLTTRGRLAIPGLSLIHI